MRQFSIVSESNAITVAMRSANAAVAMRCCAISGSKTFIAPMRPWISGIFGLTIIFGYDVLL